MNISISAENISVYNSQIMTPQPATLIVVHFPGKQRPEKGVCLNLISKIFSYFFAEQTFGAREGAFATKNPCTRDCLRLLLCHEIREPESRTFRASYSTYWQSGAAQKIRKVPLRETVVWQSGVLCTAINYSQNRIYIHIKRTREWFVCYILNSYIPN